MYVNLAKYRETREPVLALAVNQNSEFYQLFNQQVRPHLKAGRVIKLVILLNIMKS